MREFFAQMGLTCVEGQTAPDGTPIDPDDFKFDGLEVQDG
jgi:hypothetical protein